MGATGFSPPLQERDLITDQTEYRMPANVPIIEDLGPDLTLPPNRGLGARPRPGNPLYMPATPQTAEMSSVYGMPGMFQTPQTAAISSVSTNTTTQVENQIFSPAPQMQIVRQTLPVVQNTMTQQIPQQLIQIPQPRQNFSLPLAQDTPQ